MRHAKEGPMFADESEQLLQPFLGVSLLGVRELSGLPQLGRVPAKPFGLGINGPSPMLTARRQLTQALAPLLVVGPMTAKVSVRMGFAGTEGNHSCHHLTGRRPDLRPHLPVHNGHSVTDTLSGVKWAPRCPDFRY
jgi:hypothetical protein